MKTKIIKTGNSLGIIIPSYMTKVLGLEKGTAIEISLKGKKIEITKEEK